MSSKSRIVTAAFLLVAGPILYGQQTPPTTMAVADLSTPRAALRTLNAAMREGNEEVIKRLFLAVNPAETRMIDADAQMAAALADLRDAAVAAFGADHARVVTGDTAAGAAQSLARIETANISLTGDTAAVKYSGETDSPFVLKKVAGEWKVPVSQLGEPLSPAALEQRIADLAVQRKVVREITAQIRAGRFADADKARAAWQSRILGAATSRPVATPKE